jgi:hypothetical protein
MWPPEWTVSDEGLGEAGVLEEVYLRRDLNPELIMVVVNHGGDIRKGIMILEDRALLEAVYRRLKQHLGRPLAHIGKVEINPAAPMPKRPPRQIRPLSPVRYQSMGKNAGTKTRRTAGPR